MFEKIDNKIIAVAALAAAMIGLIAITFNYDSENDFTKPTFLEQKPQKEKTYPISLGALVSLECFNPRYYYLKHSSFMILATTEENSEEFRLSSSFIIDQGLTGEDTISIRSLNYPDYYIRVKNGFTIVLEQVDLTDSNYQKEASFYMRKGLADTSLISFELLSQSGVYLRQYNDQVVAAKLESTFAFKDDATWFIRPALARVDYITIDFLRDQYETTLLDNTVVIEKTYENNGSLPYVFTFNYPLKWVSATEYFVKTSGFNLISGMTYRINARVPQLDMSGSLYFTAKTIREWTYGETNNRKETYLFEQVVEANEMSKTTISIISKNAKVSIPFEALVHFDGVNFTQSYTGTWNGQFAYDYEVIAKDDSYAQDATTY